VLLLVQYCATEQQSLECQLQESGLLLKLLMTVPSHDSAYGRPSTPAPMMAVTMCAVASSHPPAQANMQQGLATSSNLIKDINMAACRQQLLRILDLQMIHNH
jgi:hypothetical protein